MHRLPLGSIVAKSRAKTCQEKRDECVRKGQLDRALIPELDVFDTEGRERYDQRFKFREIAVKFNT
jgi:hypothetical protein